MGGGGAATRFLAQAAPLSGGRGGLQRAAGGVSARGGAGWLQGCNPICNAAEASSSGPQAQPNPPGTLPLWLQEAEKEKEEEAPGEAAFRATADRMMGDLGTSGDAPFGGEVRLPDADSQVGGAMWLRLRVGVGWRSGHSALGGALAVHGLAAPALAPPAWPSMPPQTSKAQRTPPRPAHTARAGVLVAREVPAPPPQVLQPRAHWVRVEQVQPDALRRRQPAAQDGAGARAGPGPARPPLRARARPSRRRRHGGGQRAAAEAEPTANAAALACPSVSVPGHPCWSLASLPVTAALALPSPATPRTHAHTHLTPTHPLTPLCPAGLQVQHLLPRAAGQDGGPHLQGGARPLLGRW